MFPTDIEIARAKEINKNYSLFRGRFGNVLQYFRTSAEASHKIEVIENLAGMISRVFADLMFLHRPEIRLADTVAQQKINDLIFRCRLYDMLYESALTQSYAGCTFFELKLRDGLAYVEEINPALVFPQYSNMSVNAEPDKVIVSWEPVINGNTYRFQKIFTVGRIDYVLDMIDSAGTVTARNIPVTNLDPSLDPNGEVTGWDFIPIYQVNNTKSGRDHVGISDYDDLKSLFTELTRILSQIASQLKKHADAKMAVPPGVLNDKGRVINEDLEMIEVSNDENGDMIMPQYITNNNPLIEAAFKEADRVLAGIARVSEVSSTLIDFNVAGGAERVGALRLRLVRTLAKVERKLRPYERVLKDIFVDALTAEGMKNVRHGDINISFSDGLPQDVLEIVTVETQRYAAGLQTRKAAIAALDGLEGDALDKKITELKEEAQEKTDSITAGLDLAGTAA